MSAPSHTESPDMGEQLPLAFAGTSAGMALASFANAYFVRRFGLRRTAHSGILIFTAVSSLIVILGVNSPPHSVVTYLAICVLLIVFGVVMTNFSAISLQPMGHLAGTATSVTGFVSATFGAVLAVWLDKCSMAPFSRCLSALFFWVVAQSCRSCGQNKASCLPTPVNRNR